MPDVSEPSRGGPVRGWGAHVLAIGLSAILAACVTPATPSGRLPEPWVGEIPIPGEFAPPAAPSPTPHPIFNLLATPLPEGVADLEPTPDVFRDPPVFRSSAETYVVQPGDSLNRIAGQFGVSAERILQANHLANPDLLSVWMTLTIPAPIPQSAGPSTKLLPDSELIFGAAAAFFDVQHDVDRRGGFLSGYSEEVEDQVRSGAEIVALIAQRYSVNPRLLLAVLEHQSAWLRASNPEASTRTE
jgi:hypothetical protein